MLATKHNKKIRWAHLLMTVANEHRYKKCKDYHDEGGGNVTGPGHPHIHKSKMLSCSDIPHVSSIVLLLCQSLDRANEDIVVAEKVVKYKASQRVTEAGIFIRTETNNLERHIVVSSHLL